MRLGLALPQYDYSVAGESPLRWDTIVEYAAAAERAGYDSLWLSDHLFLDVAKYGGPPDQRGVLRSDRHARRALPGVVDAPAPRHARAVRGAAPRVGAGEVARHARPHLRRPARRRHRRGLVRARVRRDRHGRCRRRGERLARLREAIVVLRGLLGGGPFTFDGAYHRALRRAATTRPRSSSRRRRSSSAARATGCSRSSPSSPTAGTRAGSGRPTRTASGSTCSSARARRSAAIPRRCTRSLGLYALCGEDEADLDRRFERLRAMSPPGVLDGVDPRRVAEGRLVGTVEQVREQAAGWAEPRRRDPDRRRGRGARSR